MCESGWLKEGRQEMGKFATGSDASTSRAAREDDDPQS
jgi:hypothetical protein